MANKYTDKKLKEILENPPEMKPDFNALSDMKRRLEEAAPKKKKALNPWFWLLPLFILPFIGSSIFFYLKYETLNEKLDQLTLQSVDFQQDTVHKSYITYQYDTIYTTIYKEILIELPVEEKAFSTLDLTSRYPNLFQQNSIQGSTPSIFDGGQNFNQPGLFASPGLGLYRPNVLSNKDSAQQKLSALNEGAAFGVSKLISSLPLKLLSNPGDFNEEEKMNFSPKVFKEKNVNPLYYFVPQGGNLSLTGMPFLIGKGQTTNFFGTNLALNGALRFYQNVELEIGLERLQIKSEIKDQAEADAYPFIAPDNADDLFKEIKFNLNYLQIPVTLRKYFYSDKSFSPFFGLGLVAYKPLKQEFEYEYVNGLIGEYYVGDSFSEGAFSLNNWRVDIGGQFRLRKNMSARAGLMYQYGNTQGPGEYFNLRFGGLNLGLKYDFN